MKRHRVVERCALIAGLVALNIWIWSNSVTSVSQVWQNHVFERQLHSPVHPKRPAQVPTRSLIGRIRIPRLHLSAIVREGADAGTLELALGHIPGTAFPGQPGNVGVAGHRDTIFRPLRHIRNNDVINFETAEGTYEYRVDSTKITTPKDVSVLAPSREGELTLVTCYPFYYVGSAPNRFIVRAKQIGDEAHAPPQRAAAERATPLRSESD